MNAVDYVRACADDKILDNPTIEVDWPKGKTIEPNASIYRDATTSREDRFVFYPLGRNPVRFGLDNIRKVILMPKHAWIELDLSVV